MSLKNGPDQLVGSALGSPGASRPGRCIASSQIARASSRLPRAGRRSITQAAPAVGISPVDRADPLVAFLTEAPRRDVSTSLSVRRGGCRGSSISVLAARAAQPPDPLRQIATVSMTGSCGLQTERRRPPAKRPAATRQAACGIVIQ